MEEPRMNWWRWLRAVFIISVTSFPVIMNTKVGLIVLAIYIIFWYKKNPHVIKWIKGKDKIDPYNNI